MHQTRFPGTSVQALAATWSARWKVPFIRGTESTYAVRTDPTTKRVQRLYLAPAALSAHDLRPGDQVAEIRCATSGTGGIDAYAVAYFKSCIGSVLGGSAGAEVARWLDTYAATKPTVPAYSKQEFAAAWLNIRVEPNNIALELLSRT